MKTKNMIEQIFHKNELLSIIIKSSYKADGINFFTPDDYSQQLAYMNREKGYVILPHVHCTQQRNVLNTQEVLFIKSGKVRIDFYDNQKKYLKSKILNQGDVILLASGGHGFQMLESSEILEVKQGPYTGESDKIRFDPIPNNKICIEE